jgi:PAS domain S-box-containing protein
MQKTNSVDEQNAPSVGKKILDNTIRKRVELSELTLDEPQNVAEKLRQSEEKYRQLVHASNDGIYLLYNRKFELINKKFQEMFGVSSDDVKRPGFDFLDLVAPQSRPFIMERYKELDQGKFVESKYEFTALDRDGHQLEVETSVTFIQYKDGIATQGVVRDITQRKKWESQIRQSQKIEAISTLAGGISHDFNNILAIIRGYTELALEDHNINPQQQRNLQHVLSAADRAKELVNQILTFSRQGEENLEPVDISEIASEVVQKIRASLPKFIQVRTSIDHNACTVLGETFQMRNVIQNLCTNALHSMAETGGILDLKLQKIEITLDDTAIFKHAIPGPYFKLTVKDTGHGMKPAIVERIFEPYFTTKATGDGCGMGLAVIYGIVKNYGGDIVVRSEPQKGTSFDVYLPQMVQRNGNNYLSKTTPSETLPTGNERILLIDDGMTQLHLQQEILEPLGYVVMSVSKGIEALDVFQFDHEIFDLVIADYTLSDMSGIELAQEFLKIRVDIPIILCTGFGSNLTSDAALKIGIKGIIMKPVIKREIANVIRQVLIKKSKNSNIKTVNRNVVNDNVSKNMSEEEE